MKFSLPLILQVLINQSTVPMVTCNGKSENTFTGFEKSHAASMHNYKYLEILFLIILSIKSISGRKIDACVQYATIP